MVALWYGLDLELTTTQVLRPHTQLSNILYLKITVL